MAQPHPSVPSCLELQHPASKFTGTRTHRHTLRGMLWPGTRACSHRGTPAPLPLPHERGPSEAPKLGPAEAHSYVHTLVFRDTHMLTHTHTYSLTHVYTGPCGPAQVLTHLLLCSDVHPSCTGKGFLSSGSWAVQTCSDPAKFPPPCACTQLIRPSRVHAGQCSQVPRCGSSSCAHPTGAHRS